MADVVCVGIINWNDSSSSTKYFETNETSITLQSACDAANSYIGTPEQGETECCSSYQVFIYNHTISYWETLYRCFNIDGTCYHEYVDHEPYEYAWFYQIDGAWDVVCGPDNDTDNDGIPDFLDENTIYGTVTGAVQEGIPVNIYVLSCGVPQPYDAVITDAQGYYAIGNLPNGRYLVVPEDAGYSFDPEGSWVDIPQAEIQPYDFTATELPPSIIGTWSSKLYEGPSIPFYSNGSYNINDGAILGTYTISGNQITLIDDYCGPLYEGIYTYSINENILDLILIADECDVRGSAMSGCWERI